MAGNTISVEVININQATGVATATLVASSQAADATNLNMTGAGAVTLTGVGAAQQVGMIGALTSGAAAAALTVTQTTNGPLVLNLNGAIGSAANGALTFVDAGAATTMTINSTGAASTLQGVTLPGATTLTVNAAVNTTLGGVTDAALTTVTASGAATTVNLGALSSTVVSSINASGLTAGGMTVTLANAGLGTVTFVGGAGNDTVNLGSNVLAGAAGQIAAGAGTNTLGLTLATQLTAALAPAYTGFTNLAISGGQAQTFNVALLAGITGVSVAGVTGTVDVVNGLTALSPQAVTYTGAAGGLTLGVTNATAVGTKDTVNLTFGTAAGAAANTAAAMNGNLTMAGVEVLNLTALTGTAATTVTTLVAGNLNEVNITGNAAAVNFATGANAIAANMSVIATGSGVQTINFTGATGNAVSIATGSGNDVITGTGLNDVINGGGGNDTITGGAGADTMTGGLGNDTFVIASTATTQGVGHAAANTNVENIDKITDFVGNGAAAGDTIQLSGAANVFGAALDFATDGTTVVTVTAVTVATAGSFTALAAAMQTASAGVVSSATSAQIYDVTVTAGTMAGRYLVINDEVAAIAAANGSFDTFISITGITGALHAQDFTFA